VSVPEVQKMTVAEASSTIAAQGLKVGGITQQNDDKIGRGLVISQDPAAGEKVEKGTAVALVVSLGILQVDVPDVVGKTQDEAIATIQGAQLRIARIATGFSKEKLGTVIGQDPGAGAKVPKNTAVTITVSSGTEKMTVPDVRGKTKADARAALKDKGFSVVVKEANSNDVTAGVVIDQSPGAGVSAEKGSDVTITVSKGPATFDMPLVIGRPQTEAEKTLTDLGLVVTVTTETATTNVVLDQNPSKGTQVKKNDPVSILVGVVTPGP
jgi:serine/threonine-protein kinase